ncbi:hypothetical protein CNY89_14995 [Amaricoccus sp. HAR-UPW-R2A-40]|nr:hypothetical protein CNY89_14995 [Amaricoccus sp. HAR-UPW-R2A-40]
MDRNDQQAIEGLFQRLAEASQQVSRWSTAPTRRCLIFANATTMTISTNDLRSTATRLDRAT